MRPRPAAAPSHTDPLRLADTGVEMEPEPQDPRRRHSEPHRREPASDERLAQRANRVKPRPQPNGKPACSACRHLLDLSARAGEDQHDPGRGTVTRTAFDADRQHGAARERSPNVRSRLLRQASRRHRQQRGGNHCHRYAHHVLRVARWWNCETRCSRTPYETREGRRLRRPSSFRLCRRLRPELRDPRAPVREGRPGIRAGEAPGDELLEGAGTLLDVLARDIHEVPVYGGGTVVTPAWAVRA
jgi:hypothetical protein